MVQEKDKKSLNELKLKRNTIQGNVSRHTAFLNSIDPQQVNKRCFLELQKRSHNLAPLLHEFNAVQEQIELFEDPSDEQTIRSEFESEYYKTSTSIEQIIEQFSSVQLQASQLNTANNPSTSQVSNSNFSTQMQLPILNIESFNGNYNKWIEFRDCFQAIVGNNPTLTGVQKLCYLRKSVTSNVLKTIESFPLTNANYENAWKALKTRYEKGKRIVETHVRKIINYPCLTKESAEELRNLYDTVNNNLQALKTLNQPVGSWNAILIPIITDKLDSKTKRDYESFYIQEIEREPENSSSPDIASLLKIIKNRCELLENLERDRIEAKGNKFSRNDSKRSMSNTHVNTNSISCYFCKQDHSIYKCKRFLRLSVKDRTQEIKKLALCLNCLRPHDISQCKSSKCRTCNKAHNTLLHIDKSQINNSSNNNQGGNIENRASESTSETGTETGAPSPRESSTLVAISQGLLCTAIVFVKDSKGQTHECRALLDNGSMTNLITKQLFDSLNLNKASVNHRLIGVGQSSSNIQYKTTVNVSSNDQTFDRDLTCLIIPKITSNIPQISFDVTHLKIPNSIKLADPHFNESKPIDMLLGASIFWQLLLPEQISINNSKLILRQSKVGWLITGEMPNKQLHKSVGCLSLLDLESQVKKFWEVEEICSKPVLSKSERLCENHFLQTHKRDESGRFIVKVPFKENVNQLGKSRDFALRRFQRLEKQFTRNKSFYNDYKSFIEEYIAMGHMKEINDDMNEEELSYYIPHHAVVRPSSHTTKLRVVFDASMKSTSGFSFNDVQYVGPTIQNDLFNIIVRFRLFKFVLTADISKMYRMINISEKDKPLHRILWRNHPNEDVKCFELQTVTYGTASAPFLAIRCLHQLAVENEINFPVASNAIKNCFYVDDFLFGSDSEAEVIQVQREVNTILEDAGMILRKWLCNQPQLIDKFQLNPNLNASILTIAEHEACKTLGIYWKSSSATIQYSCTEFSEIEPTKRLILARTAQIFDPLGLLAPIIVIAKLLIQDLWQIKLDWDQEIPTSVKSQWQQFQDSLVPIRELEVPRHITSLNRIFLELHGFCDASERAFGACVYIRTKLSNHEFISRLLCAKSRVAPLKRLSIPRLELSSALLLAQLINKVNQSLNINCNKIYLWSDSTITLAWIRASPTKWKTFVANRVGEIQRLTNINDWHHVKSADNPADIISRGASAQTLKSCDLWWIGPAWLSTDSLPVSSLHVDCENLPEQKIGINTVVHESFELFDKISSVKRLQRVKAWCLRFLSNAKFKSNDLRTIGVLTADELSTSMKVLIRLAQQQSLSKEYLNLVRDRATLKGSRLSSLNPFLDSDKLIRVGGRLKNSVYSFDKRFPIVLPSNHNLTNLIFKYEHERLLHCGASALLSSIREKYWPLKGNSIAKRLVRSCIKCFRAKPKTPEYLMGDLPKGRVTPSPPFFNVGVDYAGPFLLKDRCTRGAKLVKSYICLFVCLVTKAIHIELVSNLSTECFLAALKRFIGRRGKPLNIYSDNAKNFVGASNELRELYKLIDTNTNLIQNELHKENISWHFIPARSPTFGGIWEAGIKTVKSHLKRILSNANLTYEEFQTILIQIEAVVNSRPLCPLSSDPEIVPLTPGHFLIGRSLTSLPGKDYLDIPENRLKTYQRTQQLSQHFWTRWYKEYISELQVRVKWKYPDPNNQLQVGKVVLVKEDNIPSMQWPLGIITQVHPGEDTIVRMVTVKVRDTLMKRSAKKICVLPEQA